MHGRRLLIGNAALVFLSSAVALAVGEGVARVFYTPPPQEMGITFKDRYYRFDEELRFVPNPNVRGVHEEPGKFSTTFSTNSAGLRDREHSIERARGVFRVVVLGDSFAWGYGVNDGEIFTDVLEGLIPNLEVINLGVTAYNLSQEVAYFDRVGAQFEPDAVIVAVVQNDIYTVAMALEQPQDVPAHSVEKVESIGAFLRLKRFLGSNVRLYGLAVGALNSSRTFVQIGVKLGFKENLDGFDALDWNLMPSLSEYPETLDHAWRQYTEQLRVFHIRLSERGIRLILALVPALQSVEEAQLRRSLTYSRYWLSDFDVDKPYRELTDFAEELGMEVVNPVDRFREAAADGRKLYLKHDMHFNETGHELFAMEIAEHLRRVGY